MKKRTRIKVKKIPVIITLLLFVLIIIFAIIFIDRNNNENTKVINNNEIENAKNYYNKYVKTTGDTAIYNNNKEKVGIIAKNVELELENIEVTEDTKYFKTIINDNEYFIDYNNLDKIDNLSEINSRYKKYILFNENIVTSNDTSFYNESGELMYKISESFNLPIIIKNEDSYGVEFNGYLLYVKKDDVEKIIDSQNTEEKNSTGVPVLNYHFAYEESDTSCNEEICHSATQIKEHFSYIKDNNFFTPTMEELEMYIDGKIQLPQKSVSITFDDGTRAEVAKKYVDMYEINATLFLITSWFNKDDFESDYFEVHSHGDNIHGGGVCPGGQGGAIKCMEEDKLLADLKLSREKLNNTTVFCYPFYEYNEYSIEMLKKAGFTMAFAGERAGGEITVKVNADKYRLPRWVIVNWTTKDQFISYVNGGS